LPTEPRFRGFVADVTADPDGHVWEVLAMDHG
jgi:predicted lactoylglutathione lyase